MTHQPSENKSVILNGTVWFCAGLIVLLQFLLPVQSNSQSFFYFEYSVLNPSRESQSCYSLLTVYQDGSAEARIRYIDVRNQQDCLFQLTLTDSLPSGKIPQGQGVKYLIPNSSSLISGNEFSFYPPMFEFHRNGESGYYEPVSISYLSNGEWIKAKLVDTRFYSWIALSEKFVSVFYNADEPFFENLFYLDTRGTIPSNRKTRMHLLTVANTEDKLIGNSSQKDLLTITATFTRLAEQLGIKVVRNSISGPAYSISAVENAIKALNPGSDDIVVFYYSGHGYRRPEEVSRFPNMVLSNHYTMASLSNFSLNVQEVYNTIVRKGARLNIIMSDCCNEKIAAEPTRGNEILSTRSALVPISFNNCMSLFFSPQPISILVTAADIGQLASGNPNIGGFFSWHFKTSLETHTSRLRSNVTWLQLLNEARVNTAKQAITATCGPEHSRCKQYPWFVIKQ